MRGATHQFGHPTAERAAHFAEGSCLRAAQPTQAQTYFPLLCLTGADGLADQAAVGALYLASRQTIGGL